MQKVFTSQLLQTSGVVFLVAQLSHHSTSLRQISVTIGCHGPHNLFFFFLVASLWISNQHLGGKSFFFLEEITDLS